MNDLLLTEEMVGGRLVEELW